MKLHLIFVAFFLLVLSSCGIEDENLTTPASIDSNSLLVGGVEIEFKEGIAYLPTVESAFALEDAIDGVNKESIIAQLGNVTGFTSAEEKYQQLSEEMFTSSDVIPAGYDKVAFFNTIGGDVYVDQIINIPFFMHLANENGQVVIGDVVVSLYKDLGVTIPVSEFVQFGSSPLESPLAKRFKINAEVEVAVTTPDKGNLAVNTSDYGTRRRIRGEIEQNIGFLGEVFGSQINGLTIRVRSKHYRKGAFGIFYGEKADQLRHVGGVLENTSNALFPFDVTRSNTQSFNTLVIEDSFGVQLGTGGSIHFANDGGGSGSVQIDL